MADANNPWRDKYRRALAQQENLEQTLTAYQAILQRAVMSLTSAAEGKDTGLDERLQAIRASAKHNDVAGFDRMIKSLGRVLEEVEQRQNQQWRDVSKLFSNIASQFAKLPSSGDVKPAIKQFKKQLPKDAEFIPSTLKRQLQQIHDLQLLLSSQSPQSNDGLLSKLFKSKDKPSAEAVDTEPKEDVLDADWEEVEELDEAQVELISPIEEEHSPVYRERNIPEMVLQQTIEGEAKVEVPSRVTVILLELLEQFKTTPATQQKAHNVRQRLDAGLQWYELAPTLEDVRDFVLLAYLTVDEDYRHYLESLYQELSNLLAGLGISVAAEERMRKASHQLHNQVETGVDNIQKAINAHEDTAELKTAVNDHVFQLKQALSDYQQQSQANSEGGALSDQLQALVEKVQSMEQSQTEMSHRLEEEKQKAVTDPLTGLPNREAYNERVYQEMQRWQRYQHPLTMAVIDIDFFKKINDNYGHQTGDKVLKIVSNAVVKRLREVDFMARFGGEEFVVLLPETNCEQALTLLNRIRETLANAPFKYQDEKISITVSIGISEFQDDDNSESVFARADKALYDAKESGRNRCCTLSASD